MARDLNNFPNVTPATPDYPDGRIKNETSAGANDGVPIQEETSGDHHQFLAKLMRAAGIVPNDLPENEANGHQLFHALLKSVNRTAEQKTFSETATECL